MEPAAAVDIWKKSISKYNLMYSTYLGDGDSYSFKRLKESNPYNGHVTISKEECLGHVQKRLKKRLMKKAEGSTSLPQSKADRIAHLYALVVTQNRGKSSSEIHAAFQVLLSHTKEIHDNCPPGDSSWCYYKKKRALYAIDRTVDIFNLFGWHR